MTAGGYTLHVHGVTWNRELALMSKLRLLTGALLAGSVATAACGPRISSDRDESIAIPHGATWAWGSRDSTARGERNVAESHEIMHQRFRRALEAGMLSKGFHKVDDPAQADFTLTYHVGVPQQGRQVGHPRVAVATGFYGVWGWGSYYPWGSWYGSRFGRRGWAPYYGGGFGWGWYGPPAFGWGMAYPYSYGGPNRSSVVIAILRQSSSNQVAWSGQIVTDNYDANMPMSQVQKVVNKLLEGLP